MIDTQVIDSTPKYQVVELNKCATDPIYFIENYCYIKDHRTKKAILFKLWPAQEQLVKDWYFNPYLCVLKARQIGVTWLITDCLSLWQAIFFKFQEVLIICTKEDKAIAMLEDRIKFTFSLLPDWMKPKVCVDNLTEIRFGEKVMDPSGVKKIIGNNSAIKAETAGQNAARSDTITQLIMEEMAHIEEGLNEIVLSAFPTVETCRGRIACISTAKGDVGAYRDIFWDGWNNRSSAVKASDTMIFRSSFLPWSVHPDRNQKWYDATSKMPQYKTPGDFKQEFPATPEEAFKTSGSPVFHQDILRKWNKLADSQEHLPIVRGFLKWKKTTIDKDHRGKDVEIPDPDYGLRFVENSRQDYLLYDYPEKRKTKNRYSISCDPASGELDTGTGHKKDQTSITVWDRLLMKIVCRVYSNRLDTDDTADILWKLGEWYHVAPIIVERNNHGLAVIKRLEANYFDIYIQVIYHKKKGIQPTKAPGFKTTGYLNGTRHLILSRLQTFIKEEKGAILDKEMLKQLMQFQKYYKESGEKWTAGPGANDDAVFDMALNLEQQTRMGDIDKTLYSSRAKNLRKRFKKVKNQVKKTWEVL